jgi:hypothetical protein
MSYTQEYPSWKSGVMLMLYLVVIFLITSYFRAPRELQLLLVELEAKEKPYVKLTHFIFFENILYHSRSLTTQTKPESPFSIRGKQNVNVIAYVIVKLLISLFVRTMLSS